MVAQSYLHSSPSALAGSIVNLAMDRNTAQHMVERIHEHLTRADYHVNQARKLILDLREQGGWQALGYKSWRECVMAEFERRSSTVYRQLNAALVELELSPNGGIGEINERVLRPLTKKGLDEDARHFVWQVCENIVGQGGKITSGITESVVEGLEDIIRTGAWQDAEGEQRLYGQQMSADLTARVREKKLAHKEHVKRMDRPRDYIVGGRLVRSKSRTTVNGVTAALFAVELESGAEIERLSEAMRLGKPLYISVWTE